MCGTCQGARDLLHYKVLEVKWYTEKEEGIVKSVLNPMMKDVVPDKKISGTFDPDRTSLKIFVYLPYIIIITNSL